MIEYNMLRHIHEIPDALRQNTTLVDEDVREDLLSHQTEQAFAYHNIRLRSFLPRRGGCAVCVRDPV